jgi:neuroligin
LNDQIVANFGLLDIIAALQWIKENIEQFSGDKNAVTLLGYETGAICANFLMISPVAQGLFHRAILISGSALSDWALNYNPQQITMEVAKQLNCSSTEDSQLGECLRKKSYRELVDVKVSVPEFLTIFGPIVDGMVISDPKSVMQSSENLKNFDLLFGMTEIESYNILRKDAILHGIPQSDRDHNIRRYLLNRFDKQSEKLISTYMMRTLNEYTKGFRNQPTTFLEHRDMLLEILSDARVIAPMGE